MSKLYTGLTTNGVTELTLQEEGVGNIGTPTIVWRSTTNGEIDQVQGDIPASWSADIYGVTKHLQIGSSCTSIGSNAFFYCQFLTQDLVIPDSVTSIGSYAFYYCYDANTGAGLTGSLTIPDSVTSIGSAAFYYVYGMEGTLTIGNSVTTIGDYAFAYNSFSGDLVIPNSVVSIGIDAFADNDNAFTGSLTLSQNPSFTAIPERAFIGTPFTGTLDIPDNITTIDVNAFRRTNFSTIVIPDSITSIGSLNFQDNLSLTAVYTACPASSWVGVSCFRDSTNLTDIYVRADQLAGYDATWRSDQAVDAGATISTWTNYPNIP